MKEENKSYSMRFRKFFESKTIKLFLILFFIALIPRIFCLIQMQNSILSNMLHLDALDYDEWAKEIASGDWIGKEVFYAMPFYAYFLGVIYFLFGHSLLAIRVIQILLGALNCVLTFYIARRLFKDINIALLSFVVALFFKLAVFYELFLVACTISTTLFLLILYKLLSISERPTIPKFISLALLISLATLTRANFLILIPLIIIWFLISSKNITKNKKILTVALFVITIFITISPVAMRNYRLEKDFVPLTAHGGINFYLGNGPYADGRYPQAPFLARESKYLIRQSVVVAEKELGKDLKPSEASLYWFNKSTDFIKKHPQLYINLLFQKIKLFISGFEMPDIFSYSFSYSFIPTLKILFIDYILLIPLGIAGIMLTMSKNKSISIFCIIFLGYAVGIIMFLVNERYKIPLYPFFVLFSSSGLIYLFKSSVDNKRKIVAIITCIILTLPLLDKSFIKRFGVNQSASYRMIGHELLVRKDMKEAKKYFLKSLELEPGLPQTHLYLGLVHEKEGNLVGAEKEYKKTVELDPNYSYAYYYLSRIYSKQHDYERSNTYMQKYKELQPYEK